MSMTIEFEFVEVLDPDDPDRRLGVTVRALDRAVGISNTTERALRIVLGAEERVLSPSPGRDDCVVVGIVLWRVGDDFDCRAIDEPDVVEPVHLDALCVEVLLPGGAPPVH